MRTSTIVGISYMLAGDQGANNTDSKATKKTAGNHWIVIGRTLLVIGTVSKSLGYPEIAGPLEAIYDVGWHALGTAIIPVSDRKTIPRLLW